MCCSNGLYKPQKHFEHVETILRILSRAAQVIGAVFHFCRTENNLLISRIQVVYTNGR